MISKSAAFIAAADGSGAPVCYRAHAPDESPVVVAAEVAEMQPAAAEEEEVVAAEATPPTDAAAVLPDEPRASLEVPGAQNGHAAPEPASHVAPALRVDVLRYPSEPPVRAPCGPDHQHQHEHGSPDHVRPVLHVDGSLPVDAVPPEARSGLHGQ